MTEAFSFSREFDFVRLDGLRRATGRPPHEWDLYIVKELIDNALDADETLWCDHPEQFPCVHVRMEYIGVPKLRSQQLFVQVRNRAAFPIEQMADIFDTRWYTSHKAFIKGLTRGALGNALKTLLGIPYALRHRIAGDWGPDLKPLSILCDGTEYLPRYVVDSTAQTIDFKCERQESKPVEGTVVSIGLDDFEQEMPRTLAQVESLAQQYHLCNPHAEFHWTVEIGGQEWKTDYPADPGWMGKFCGIASVHWYSPRAFQDLLSALYRKECCGDEICQLPVESVCRFFSEVDSGDLGFSQGQLATTTIVEALGQDGLSETDIEGPMAMRLYRVLHQYGRRLESTQLGCIGREHVRAVLSRALPVDGDVLHATAVDAGDDPNVPFIIEAAAAPLKDGKRHIWTAINFAPTYGDPFLRRWLRAPIQPNAAVFGLRGLLDAYGMLDNTPVVLFLHVICPSIEYDESSKTEIEHLAFKQVLGDVLNQVLKALRQAQEEEELRLEQVVFGALDTIVAELDPDERFVFDQLLEKLRARLSQDPDFAAWLETPDALTRLGTYVADYQRRNAILTHHVAGPTVGTLSIPLHPDRHFSVLTRYMSHDLLAQHHVGKILYVQVRELEPVVLENGWLCRMDMALLRNPTDPDGLHDALVQCAVGSPLPILVLRNADEAGRATIGQMRKWLEGRGLNPDRIVDLGLDAAGVKTRDTQLTRLVEMMPGELATWLLVRLEALDIPVKSLPADSDIRQDIRQQFERLLLGHVWEGMSQQLKVIRLLGELDRELNLTETMIDQALDKQLRRRLEQESCVESYTMILDEVVGEFFRAFMAEHDAKIRDLVQVHLGRVHRGQK